MDLRKTTIYSSYEMVIVFINKEYQSGIIIG